MKAFAIVLIGVALIALAAGALAPASLVDARLAQETGGALRIAEAQGTVWNGRGLLTSREGSWQLPLAWRLSPLPLLRGVADITLIPMEGVVEGPEGRVQLESNRLRADRLVIVMPVAAITATMGKDAPSAGGQIVLRADTITLAREQGAGSVELDWRAARVVLPGRPTLDLGTVSARLAVRDNELGGPVTSRNGQIRVRGDMVLGTATSVLNLELAPNPSATPPVRAALATFGPVDPHGAVKLRLQRGAR